MRELRGTIAGIHVSNDGVPKRPIEEATVEVGGITKDRQADRRAHGGPLRALCLYSLEAINQLAAAGHDIAPGHLGENVTVEGIDWKLIVPGMRMRLGEQVECEVTSYTEPCWKNAHWFDDGDITRILQEQNPGFSRVYARVLVTGTISIGDAIVVQVETAAERIRRQQPKTFRWSPPD
jgi:MOSC domain-containing protein YiiM